MAIRKRLITACVLIVFASVLYGTAKHYSPYLVLYVVEQSLIQKAPQGTDPMYLRNRVEVVLSASPDQKTKMEKLLRISEQLEKVQKLTPEEMDGILSSEGH